MAEHKMPEPVAWRCNWRKSGQIGWVQYHDEIDPLPETWDARPNETIPLYSAETVQALQSEVERLRAERDALAQDAARLNWLDANGCQRFMGPREDIRGPDFQWFDFDGARDYAATLRELIDDAMAPPPQGEEAP